MISTKVINDIKVKLIPNDVAHGPENPMFARKYPNVFLSGKKQSGKTTIIYTILEKYCSSKGKKKGAKEPPMVIFFVSSLNKDASYKRILAMLDAHKVYHEDYMSIFDDDGQNI